MSLGPFLVTQAAKTYLERKFETFPSEGLEGLIRNALQALSASVTDGELTKDNCTVAVVGKDMPFTILEGEDLAPHIALLKVMSGLGLSCDISCTLRCPGE